MAPFNDSTTQENEFPDEQESLRHDSDQSSATDGDSGTGGSRSSATGETQDRIIKKEERTVKRAKVFVGLCVLLCAVSIILAVYFLTSMGDKQSFELAVSCFDEGGCERQIGMVLRPH